MKSRGHRLPLLSTAVLIALTVAACGSGTAAPGGQDAGSNANDNSGKIDPLVTAYKGPKVDLSGVSLTVTTSEPDALNMGALFMFDKLRQWGAKLDVVTLTTTSGIQTMIAGRSQLASQGADEVVLGRGQGADVTAIGSARSKQVYVLVAKNSIDGVSDLKGKKIAMSGPSGFDTLLSKYALKKAGLAQTDAKLVQIGGSPDRGAALIAGTVDAATIFLSTWENVKSRAKGLHLIENFASTTKFPGDAYYAMTSYLDKNPKLALGVACANLEANDWINSGEKGFIDFAQRHVKGVDPASLKVLWQDSQRDQYYPTDPTQVISADGLGSLETAMLDSGEITKKASVADAVDTSFLQKAATMGCGSTH
ncbi:MAG TPA: ABC transporter substrate-binding protein [Mycobacteriales bacterium]|nr:ABC transporter substrate-binding protein [Mycobacteriales bacterium]